MGEEEKGWFPQPLQPLGSGGGGEVIIFHPVIHSARVLKCLLRTQSPGRHPEPMSDADSHRADVPKGRLGQGERYKRSHCKYAAEGISRGLGQAVTGGLGSTCPPSEQVGSKGEQR